MKKNCFTFKLPNTSIYDQQFFSMLSWSVLFTKYIFGFYAKWCMLPKYKAPRSFAE